MAWSVLVSVGLGLLTIILGLVFLVDSFLGAGFTMRIVYFFGFIAFVYGMIELGKDGSENPYDVEEGDGYPSHRAK